MKPKVYYVCQQCGYKSASMMGRCPSCDNWNSLVETVEEDKKTSWKNKGRSIRQSVSKIKKLSQVKTAKIDRLSSGMKETDRVLGFSGKEGGLVPGSIVLLAGDPGIGKSTLMLQIISSVKGLYVSGEESAEQVKLRAERLGLDVKDVLILSETNIDAVIEAIKNNRKKIAMVVVDSIQTIWTSDLSGAPGSVGQVRECALRLMNLSKSSNLPILLIGHMTKEGTIAGPKILEHIVDTVLYLEGDRYQSLRLLRTNKNRFGPVDEIGVFSMTDTGMAEISNPSEVFLQERTGQKKEAGRVAVATLEGTRPLLVEVQALSVPTYAPIPKRIATGLSISRVQMLIAILQKHLKLSLGKYDVFVNVASGIKVFEPAADLGICLAITSSFKNISLPKQTVAIGEVGLLGEIRRVIGQTRRIKEAKRLGFKKIISSNSFSYLEKLSQSLF